MCVFVRGYTINIYMCVFGYVYNGYVWVGGECVGVGRKCLTCVCSLFS